MTQDRVRMPIVQVNMVDGQPQPTFGPIPAGFIRVPAEGEGGIKVYDVRPKDDCKTCLGRGTVHVLQMEQDGGVKEGDEGRVLQGCPASGCSQDRIAAFVRLKQAEEWARASSHHAAQVKAGTPAAVPAVARREKPVDEEMVKTVKALQMSVDSLGNQRDVVWGNNEKSITVAREAVVAATEARDGVLNDANVCEKSAKELRSKAEEMCATAEKMDDEADQIMECVGILRKQAATESINAVTLATLTLQVATEKQEKDNKAWVRKLKDPKRRLARLKGKLPDEIVASIERGVTQEMAIAPKDGLLDEVDANRFTDAVVEAAAIAAVAKIIPLTDAPIKEGPTLMEIIDPKREGA